MQDMDIRPLSWEDPLEKEMVTHSSIPACKIPWTEEPGYSPWSHKRLNSLSHNLMTKQRLD